MAKEKSSERSRTSTSEPSATSTTARPPWTAALTKVSADNGWSKFISYDEVAKAFRLAGPPRCDQDPHHRDLARGVRVEEAALRARGLPGTRGTT